MKPANLTELKAAWLAAKRAEEAANAERRQVEEAMLALLPSKLEGTVSDKDSGVSVTFKVTRKVDTAALQAAWMGLGERAQQVFTWKADVSTRQLNTLAEFDQAAHAAVSQFITATLAKPSITVKEN